MKKRELPCNKKSMLYKVHNPLMASVLRLSLAMLLAFSFAGCATKPWNDQLGPDQVDETRQLIDTLTEREANCGQSFSGDISLFYKSPLDNRAINGFLQFSLPSSFKFTLTNPFGQPLFIVAGNQKAFQAINTGERRYYAGNLYSFGVRNNIDSSLLVGNWGDWLTGRNHVSGQEVKDIRGDRDNRGVWFTLPITGNGWSGSEHLLLAPEKQLYLTRIVEDANSNVVAEISYGEWSEASECRQPLDIQITGLDYGTEVRVKLSDVVMEDKPQKYVLPIPTGYLQQFLP